MQKAMLLAAAAELVVVGTADARQPSKTGTPAQVQRLMEILKRTTEPERGALFGPQIGDVLAAEPDATSIDAQEARHAIREKRRPNFPNR